MNYLIYENADIQLWWCGFDCEFHITDKNNKSSQISFEEFVREIDTIPERSWEWKQNIISFWADRMGFFGKAGA